MFKKLKNFFYFYLPVLLWMGFIFFLSSIPGLKTGTESIALEIIFRKIAHLGEFAILGLLLLRAIKQSHSFSNKTAYVLTLMAVFAFAVSDEIHQFFVSQRAGRVSDVAIDFLGGLLGIGFFEAVRWFLKNKNSN